MTSKPIPSIKRNTLVSGEDLSNEQYHSLSKWISSSRVKDALGDIRSYHKTYITKESPKEFARQTQIAMDIGTYFHTAILEPDKLSQECSVWDGQRKGKAYEEFMAQNKGKTVITASDFEKAQALILGTKKDPASMQLLSQGIPELSAFTRLKGINVRVRADWIDLERGFIMDLKSTSGSVFDENDIKKKIDNLHYDLSAAMYLDAFNAVLRAQKLKPLTSFYWVFASKDTGFAQVYRASDRLIDLGRRKYLRALNIIRENELAGWEFESKAIEIDPAPWADAAYGETIDNNSEEL